MALDRQLKLRPWRPGDESEFEPRPEMAAELAENAWDWSKGAPGPVWTLVRRHGQVAGVGGGVDLGDGAWRVWSAVSHFSRVEWALSLPLATRVLDHLIRDRGARIIYAEARDTGATVNTGAALCLRRLGFAHVGWSSYDGVGRYRIMVREA